MRSPVRELTSPTNALIKTFRRALKDGATHDGWLAVEGPRWIEEALNSGAARREITCAGQVRSIVVARSAVERFSELLARATPDVEIAAIPDQLFAQLAQTVTPQGIAALVEIQRPPIEDALSAPHALLVIACGIQEPGNLGAILRSAEALGAGAVLALEGTVSPSNPKTVRSSGGAIFHLPVYAGLRARDLVARLKRTGIQVIAADRHGGIPASHIDLRPPSALLIGGEAAGLDAEILQHVTQRAAIPIRQGVDSLNAAAAAAILLYEAARQRGFIY